MSPRARIRMLSALVGVFAMLSSMLALAPVASADEGRSIEFVVDVSGSMRGSRIAQAQDALRASIDALRPSDAAALRSYAGSCGNGGVLRVPFGTDNRADLRAAVDALRTGGGTPTPDALRAAGDDVADAERGVIVLVSDGASSCGDPCPTARQLVEEQGTALRAFTVGFQASAGAARELACIAEATGGQYFSASDADELAAAIDGAIGAGERYVAFGDSFSPEFRS